MNRIIYFIIIFIAWLLMTFSLDIENIVAGIIICIICTAFLGHLFFENSYKMFSPKRIFWLIYFIPVFTYQMIKANFDVAYRVLHIDVPIRPGIVKIKTSLKTDLGLTFLANSITLTPGTLTVDIIGDEIYVHWINVQTEDSEKQAEIIARRFEKILKKVFE